jgi:tetratricopeptide (TPR) repeat protein
MAAHPVRTAGLWLKKVWLHLQGWEIDQLTPLSGWRTAAPALDWLPVPFALLVALGLGGAAGWWHRVQVRWWVTAAAALVAGQSLFFVVSRYRLALVPILCLLAVVGGLEILRKNRRALVASLLGVLITIPWGLAETRQMWRAQALANEAVRWVDVAAAEGSPEATATALRLYREAVAGQAVGPAPWLGLGNLLIEAGDLTEAARILAEAEEVNPGNLTIMKLLLNTYLQMGQTDQALDISGRILARRPRDPDTLHNRTLLLAAKDRSAEAMTLARKLIAAHPGDPRGYIDLGVLLARSGRRQEARQVFQQGLVAVPGHPQLQQNLDLVQP